MLSIVDQKNLGLDDNDTAGLLDLLLRPARHESSLDDDGSLWDAALAEELLVAEAGEVEDWGLVAKAVGIELLSDLRGEEGVELVEVDDAALLGDVVEATHTDLSKVTRVVLVHVDAVVVLTTGETTTTGVLPVLADTTVTGRDVATVLSSVAQSCGHGCVCV